MKLSKLLDINLALFDGEGSSGEGAGNSGVTGETMADSVAAAQKTGEKVLYGKQDAVITEDINQSSDAESKTDEKSSKPTLEERKKAFKELINGDEYKDIYADEVQRIIDRRFKEVKTLEQNAKNTQELVDLLNTKYKLDNADIQTLKEAIEKDEDLWAEAADAKGMTVEQYREFQKTKLENLAMKREREMTLKERFAQQQINQWNEQANEVKAVYPDFDFRAEFSNPDFQGMIRAGIPMQKAYEVMHMDDIKNNVAQSAAKQTEKQVVDSVRSKGNRPAENGISSQSGFTVKDDVSKWTKDDIKEVIRRVERGEIIKL